MFSDTELRLEMTTCLAVPDEIIEELREKSSMTPELTAAAGSIRASESSQTLRKTICRTAGVAGCGNDHSGLCSVQGCLLQFRAGSVRAPNVTQGLNNCHIATRKWSASLRRLASRLGMALL